MLTYPAECGPTLYDRRLCLPAVWAQDAPCRRDAGAPEEIAFATKPELGIADADAVRHLSAAGVPDDVREDASDLATTIRAEVARDEPDPGTLRRAAAGLKGYLAPIAITTVTAGAAVGGEETAHALIERLGSAL